MEDNGITFNFEYGGQNVTLWLPRPNDFMAKVIIETKSFYESRYLNFLKHDLKLNPRDIAIDCGANIGNHTVFFAKILGFKKVYAFEPQNEMFDAIGCNVILNNLERQVIRMHAGVSAIPTMIYKQKETKGMAGSTIFGYDKGTFNESPVSAYPLDSIIHQKVDLIKIDVEGMEMEVLAGAESLINTYSPIIMIEVFSKNSDQFEKWILDHNYHHLDIRYFCHNTYLIGKK